MIRCSEVNEYDKNELPCKSDRCCLSCYKYNECESESRCNYSDRYVNLYGCKHRIGEQKE